MTLLPADKSFDHIFVLFSAWMVTTYQTSLVQIWMVIERIGCMCQQRTKTSKCCSTDHFDTILYMKIISIWAICCYLRSNKNLISSLILRLFLPFFSEKPSLSWILDTILVKLDVVSFLVLTFQQRRKKQGLI